MKHNILHIINSTAAFVCAILLITVMTTATSCHRPEVKNVIYIIGDGMGHGAVSLVINKEGKSAMEKATTVTTVTTRSANAEITDSAAGGTALSTGSKTNNDTIGLSPEGDTLTSVLVKAQQLGKKTGIIVTCAFIDATPAAFFAHVPSRSKGWDIAAQFVESDIDLLFGSGMRFFNDRPDSINLVPALEKKGYTLYEDWDRALQSDVSKIIALPSVGYVYERPADYLPDALTKATDILSKDNDKGFFLMVESSYIDGYGHRNQTDSLYEEILDIDKTLQVAMDFADNNPGTLVIMTADHETGGVTLTHSGIQFSTKGHTAAIVPLFAYGAGSHHFNKVLDNTEIPKIIEKLMQ
ncbi:MAG: alkaline phosphatase [Bacteroidales bacterium]|nr:alkaline phosphatase [Bacteroidales bacterium]MDD4670054.1 alkaline phosphatase [Bacteroidales bacterium]